MSNNRKMTVGRRHYMIPLYKEVQSEFGPITEYTGKTKKVEVKPSTTLFKKHDHIHTAREKELRRQLRQNRNNWKHFNCEPDESKPLRKELRELMTPAILR